MRIKREEIRESQLIISISFVPLIVMPHIVINNEQLQQSRKLVPQNREQLSGVVTPTKCKKIENGIC